MSLKRHARETALGRSPLMQSVRLTPRLLLGARGSRSCHWQRERRGGAEEEEGRGLFVPYELAAQTGMGCSKARARQW